MVFVCVSSKKPQAAGKGDDNSNEQKEWLDGSKFSSFRQAFFVGVASDEARQPRQVTAISCSATVPYPAKTTIQFLCPVVHAGLARKKSPLPVIGLHSVSPQNCSHFMQELESSFPTVTRRKGLGSSFDSESSSESSTDSSDDEEERAARQKRRLAKKSKHQDVRAKDGFHERGLSASAKTAVDAHIFVDFEAMTARYSLSAALSAALQTYVQQSASFIVIRATSATIVAEDESSEHKASGSTANMSLVYSSTMSQHSDSLNIPSQTLSGKPTESSRSIPVPFNQRGGQKADESAVYSVGLPRMSVSGSPNAGKLTPQPSKVWRVQVKIFNCLYTRPCSGKTANECLDNMRRRHASGSFMVSQN